MFENMLSVNHISYFLVFLEGILSFFSPCVLPLIPVYIGYLAGNGKETNEQGEVSYQKKTVLINTILFVLGISFAFFILGMSFSALGNFLNQYKDILIKVAGVIIILLGLIQLGVFKRKGFQKEHRFHFKLNGKKMNPFIAFVLGFTFSFAWTPCVGPALASVLVLASSSSNVWTGNLLVLMYSLGFIIPFLIVGLFTTQVLTFLKKRQKAFQYTVKAAAVILIVIGVMTLTGFMSGITSYFTSLGSESSQRQSQVEEKKETDTSTNTQNNKQEGEKSQKSLANDFELTDQYGTKHKLSDYKGKVVFLNFWATWCPPCKEEMPYIEEIYKEYGKNAKDVIILGVANPKSQQNPYGSDEKKEVVTEFLTKNNYTFPVVFDETGGTFTSYHINSFPTTFMIDKQGKIFGYVQGAMEKSTMKDIIEQTIQGKRK